MKNKYRIYKVVDEEGVTEDGGKLEWSHGCDGQNHARQLNELFYEDGAIEHGRHISTLAMGPCDGVCTPEDLGGFLFHAHHANSQAE